MSMVKDVIEFNRIRNGFQYIPELECDMFNEEVKEFFNATTLAERVDALIDTMYVKIGTMCKLAFNGLDPDSDMPYPHKEVIDIMVSCVSSELGSNYARVIKEAERIVCEINAQKVSKLDKNGKVIKQKNLRNATDEINNMISELLKDDE